MPRRKQTRRMDLHIFETIDEVQQIATEWLWAYNNDRTNMGNGGMVRGFARSGLKRSTGSFPCRPSPPAQKLRMAA